MAYSTISRKSGRTYYLHSKNVTLRGGKRQTIYYFAGKAASNAVNTLPSGYRVIESQRTGLPLLKKS